MLRQIARFVSLTVLVFVAGFMFVVAGVIMAGIGDDPSTESPPMIIGAILMFFSPVIAGIVVSRSNRQTSISRSPGSRRGPSGIWSWLPHPRRRSRAERERLTEAVDRHRTALARNLHRAVKTNDYGVIFSDVTNSVFIEFFTSIRLNMKLVRFQQAAILVSEQLALRQAQDRQTGFDLDSLPSDGHAFEGWVTEALVTFGWDAEVTRRSGDQGIDVLASKNGKNIGIQCKLYGSSVGNKAIQEAYAGKIFYGVDAACVISNTSFTSSARELASATGVRLLSVQDLPRIYEILFETR